MDYEGRHRPGRHRPSDYSGAHRPTGTRKLRVPVAGVAGAALAACGVAYATPRLFAEADPLPATAAFSAIPPAPTVPASATSTVVVPTPPPASVTGTTTPVGELDYETTTTATTASSTTASKTATKTPTKTAAASKTTPVSRSAERAAPAAPSGGIVQIAAGYLGVPYVYGGTTPAGWDCSGYTSYVYRQAGIAIPRTSQAQQAAAVKVSNPAPGDLVFFGYPATHVGIFVSPGKMYDAPRPGRVTGLHDIYTTVSVSYGRLT